MNRFVLIMIGLALCNLAPAAGRQLPSLSGVAREAFEQAVVARGASMVVEAVRYEHGEGVPRDLPRAVALYCQAARQGHAEAQYKLGWIYANGRGVERDDSVARMFFEVAADQGHEYAKRMLGFLPARAGARFPVCMTPPPAQDAPPLARNENDELDGFLALDPNKQKVVEAVRRLAPKYELDPRLVLSVIAAESAFSASARSPKNAQGLMQLIPATAERFNVKNTFDMEQNLKGGMAYLQWLLAFFKGEVDLVLAAYNAGEHAVERYRGVPPYAETQEYVKRVSGLYRKATHPYKASVSTPSPLMLTSRKS